MNNIDYIKMFFLSIVLTMTAGTVIDRLLPGWEGLVSDVGSDGGGSCTMVAAFVIACCNDCSYVCAWSV